MNPQAFEKLRSGNPDCPSDLDLDQLFAGELLAPIAARVSTHVSGCALCAARMESRKAGFDAISDVDPRPLLAGIRRRIDAEELAQKKRRAWRRVAYVLTPVAAMAAVLAIIAITKKDASSLLPIEDGVREKGGVALRVHRFASGKSQRVLSGDQFFAGDRLRFVIDLPAAGHVNVLGVEASGNLYVAWPVGQGVSTLRPSGKDQELPGAVLLDSSTGRETLYLVFCPPAIGTPSTVCKTAGAATPPSCPALCANTPFVLSK